MAMQTGDLIAANELCIYHNIEYSFISSLSEQGLIEITTIEETRYIPTDQLHKLEQYIRLHTDLDINLPGIEAVSHLLERIESMQRRITSLQNKLRLYDVINGGAEEEI
jgi:chaperone modulatory protein CbpM